jgi:thiamine pyrophosphokinase
VATALADRSLLVAVDGGLRTCRAARLPPDLFVGDADSVAKPPSGVESVLFAPDKDFSDLAGALRLLCDRNVQLLVVVGLLGGRLDHEWANLLELGTWARRFVGIVASTDRGSVSITCNGLRLETVPGHGLSLFGMNAGATVTLHGTRWQLERRRLRPGSRGLSNVTGSALELRVHRGTAALVVPTRETKSDPTRETKSDRSRKGQTDLASS